MEIIDRVYKKNESFVFRKIEAETLLVPIKDNVGDMGSIYNLNDVGAFVWEQIDGVNSLQDIKNKLLEEYEVSSREAEDDLVEYIAQLSDPRQGGHFARLRDRTGWQGVFVCRRIRRRQKHPGKALGPAKGRGCAQRRQDHCA